MQQLFDLIEYTHRSIFLTGKAGTGKTTFLNWFVQKTQKNYIVVAPTGIAAINAGGVTIHSMFGLPLQTHVPTFDDTDPNIAINIQHLLPHFKYRREKLKLLRNLDILIVDEVSMLRCDVMDMMDLALRTARRTTQKFGGVQLLLIGDLYQLPPVVKQDSESILNRYYHSPYFFDAAALKDLPLLTVELKKVYRQTDGNFLQMLNAIRNRDFDAVNFEELNARYQPDFEPQEFYVHLTTHNRIADAINNRNLEKIDSKPFEYKAIVSGDFKPHLYPNEETLILKEGAQVMFIRNDSTEAKRYFNGKLGVVTLLDEDHVHVLPDNETEELIIERELWENKKYSIDSKNNIQEDVVGSYEQFPFRLAWAVTIHKSQGLTFDRVIIDAGRSFTSGQVYVALSRCRTLEGIILKSTITPAAILTDSRIARFQEETDAGNHFEAILEDEKYNYAVEKLLARLDVHWLNEESANWQQQVNDSRFLHNEQATTLAVELIEKTAALVIVFEKFAFFSRNKAIAATQETEDWLLVEEKSVGAVNYFFEQVNASFFNPLKNIYAETKGQSGLKNFNTGFKTFLEDLENYLKNLQDVTLLGKKLYQKTIEEDVNIKVAKKPSHLISFEMFEAGKSVQKIAEERGVTEGTILSHLAKMASVGVLDIEKLFSKEMLNQFAGIFEKNTFNSLGQWKSALPESFGFNEIRVLLNHFNYHNRKTEKTDNSFKL
ncbi:MAG: helix-turn-helix domain-containing protein [Niabella sp.]